MRIKLIRKYLCVECNREFETALEAAEHKCEEPKAPKIIDFKKPSLLKIKKQKKRKR